MTREEEIIEASQLYAKAQQKPFMDGAMCADKHPTEEVQRLKRMFESDPDIYEQGYKDAVDKASKWLIDNLPLYFGQINADNTDRFVRIFRKAIEEQQ